MNKKAVAALIAFAAAAPALAGEWKILPILDKDHKFEPVLSVAGGWLDPKGAKDGDYYGVELAFNCGLIQTPSGVVRSKISYGQYDKNGLELEIFEVNPRWTNNITKDLTFGIGPGIGYVKADTLGRSTSLAAFQIGADLDYRIGMVNLGLGARWQDTRDKLIAPGVSGADNWLVQAKVGIAF